MSIMTDSLLVVKIPLETVREELINYIIAMLEIERYEKDFSFQQ